MEDKLYAHHAEQDSLEVSDAEINDYVGRTIDYFVQELLRPIVNQTIRDL